MSFLEIQPTDECFTYDSVLFFRSSMRLFMSAKRRLENFDQNLVVNGYEIVKFAFYLNVSKCYCCCLLHPQNMLRFIAIETVHTLLLHSQYIRLITLYDHRRGCREISLSSRLYFYCYSHHLLFTPHVFINSNFSFFKYCNSVTVE